ncbi:unnamed protein product, partial [Cladocopium goreaui]
EARTFLGEADADSRRLFYRMASTNRVRYSQIVGPAMALGAYLAKLGWKLTMTGAIECQQFHHLHIVHSNQDELLDSSEAAWMTHVSMSIANRKHLRNLPPIDRQATCSIFSRLHHNKQRSVGLDICIGYMTNQQKAHFDELQSEKCQYCDAHDSVEHRVLSCPATAAVRSSYPEVCDFLEQHDMIHTVLPVLYKDPEVEAYAAVFETFPEPDCTPLTYKPVCFFTDGSCHLPQDRTHCWASYAIVCTHHQLHDLPVDKLEDAPWLLHNCFDTLAASHVTGKQNIARAELMAAVIAHELELEIPVVTDSQYVISAHAAVENTPHSWKLHKKKNYDLLKRLHVLHWEKRRDIPVRKVRAHQSISPQDADAFEKVGNRVADCAANLTQKYLAKPAAAEDNRSRIEISAYSGNWAGVVMSGKQPPEGLIVNRLAVEAVKEAHGNCRWIDEWLTGKLIAVKGGGKGKCGCKVTVRKPKGWNLLDGPESAESCTFAHGANYLRRTIGFAKPEKEEKTEINGLQENVDVVDVATGTPPAWLPKMFELEMLRQQESTLQLQQMIQDQQQQIEILKNQLLLQEQVQLKMVMNPGTNPSPPPAAYKVPYVQPPIQAMSPMSPATAATTMSCDLRLSL